MPEVELSLRERAVVAGTAAADVALRTGMASALTLPTLAWVASGAGRDEAGKLDAYREVAGDREAAFPAPDRGATITRHPAPRFTFRPHDGTVELLRFDSPYRALNPAVRESYAGFAENHVAWAQHWRHDDGPRPTLVVVHGFGASPYWLNSAFFALPWLYTKGYDLLMFLLPFHGVRQPKLTPFSGWGLFAHGPAHFNEAILHGVHDLRLLLDHLEAEGVERFGVTGLSLGGYVAALMASVEPRIHVAIPNAPVVHLPSLIGSWFPVNTVIENGRRLIGVDADAMEDAMAVHSPLAYDPLTEHRMIIGGLGDRLAPPEQAELLWEHWGRCRLHWFPGNHVVHVSGGEYRRKMLRFMRDAGFGA
jgi:hypothetical protein